jgi:hypothetical protein
MSEIEWMKHMVGICPEGELLPSDRAAGHIAGEQADAEQFGTSPSHTGGASHEAHFLGPAARLVLVIPHI